MRAMSSSRFLVAFGIVLALMGLAYLCTRPGTRIDQTVTTGAPSSTPPARKP